MPWLRLPLASLLAVALIGPAAAAELPPERPTTPYRAKVRHRHVLVKPDGDRSGADTLVIRVAGPLLYQASQQLGAKTVIVDARSRQILEFAPGDARQVAARLPQNDAPIPYVDGRAAIVAIDPAWGEPRIAGADRVARRACTVLEFGDPEADGARACVSKEGVVLRLRLVWPGYERAFEVLDFAPGPQGGKWFRPPRGFAIVDG